MGSKCSEVRRSNLKHMLQSPGRNKAHYSTQTFTSNYLATGNLYMGPVDY